MNTIGWDLRRDMAPYSWLNIICKFLCVINSLASIQCVVKSRILINCQYHIYIYIYHIYFIDINLNACYIISFHMFSSTRNVFMNNHRYGQDDYWTSRSDMYCSDVIRSTITPQITGISIIYSTVCLGTYQRKHESSASLALVRGIHRWPVNLSRKRSVARKLFPFDDVIMDTFDSLAVWQIAYFTRHLVYIRNFDLVQRIMFRSWNTFGVVSMPIFVYILLYKSVTQLCLVEIGPI